MFLANGRVGIIDLQSKEVSEEDLSGNRDSHVRSSIATAEELQMRHGGDAVVLGTGVLTGSLVPAACGGVLLGAREGPRRRVAPLLGLAGVELKLTGFDFIVLKGMSKELGYLWIRDGIIEFVAATDMESADAWQRTDKIRTAQGDQKIQVISTGRASAFPDAPSQFLVNYWGGEDKECIARDLTARNVLAVALRGMGELEASDADRHFDECSSLRKSLIEKLGHDAGLSAYSEVARSEDFRALQHRNVACFGCTFPCRSFLKVHEDPKEMRLSHEEPGYLHYDIPALEKAFSGGMTAEDTTHAMIACAKAGAEPYAVLSAAVEEGTATLDLVRRLLSDAARTPLPDERPKNFERSFGSETTYLECLGLGLCPRYWEKAGFSKASLSGCVESALGRGL